MKARIALFTLFITVISAKPKKVPSFISKPPSRIVGGVEATPHEFPWMVDMRQGIHYCGGSIYNEEWVVTAAHCAESAENFYTLTAGDHNVEIEGEPREQKRQVFTIIKHPDYGTGIEMEADIALMRVSPKFEFNEYVQPIRLARPGSSPGARAIVAGWGDLYTGGPRPDVLYKVDVPVVSDEDCRRAYGEDNIADSMICSGEGGKDSCQGDSGGPMTCNDGNNGTVLCGIVSWGNGCALPGYPGVYTEVSYFSEWVEQAIVPPPDDNSTWVEQREGCGGVLTGSSGFVSYKLGQTYEPNERCVWTIRVTRANLRLRLRQSGLEAGDVVTVTEIFGDGSTTVTRILNDNDVTLIGSTVLVTFRSNGEGQGQGFSFEFYGTGFLAAPVNYNHFHLNETIGVFSHPASGYYQPSEYTTIVLNPSTGSPTLKFDRLDIEDAPGCAYDSVDVLNYNGQGYHYGGKYCVPPLPAPIVASDGILVLIFHSDDEDEFTGFKISWASFQRP